MRQTSEKHPPAPARRPRPATTPADREAAAHLADLMVSSGGRGAQFVLTRADGASADLSAGLLSILQAVAGMVANGTGVTVLAKDEALTTQQAADLLNVSRQYLVTLLDRGDIPSSKVGTHRRVRADDLATYRTHRDAERRAALSALTQAAEASGAYDEPMSFGPRRRG